MKKFVRIFLPILLLAAIGYGGYRMAMLFRKQKEVQEKTATIPAFSLKTTDGKMVTNANLPKNKPIIFLYFNSDCEYCQEETKEIVNDIEKFKAIQLIFVSFEELPETIRFQAQYQLDKLDNILFLQDYQNTFEDLFGIKTLPSSLIYDLNGQLLSRNNGAVKVDYMLKILKK